MPDLAVADIRRIPERAPPYGTPLPAAGGGVGLLLLRSLLWPPTNSHQWFSECQDPHGLKSAEGGGERGEGESRWVSGEGWVARGERRGARGEAWEEWVRGERGEGRERERRGGEGEGAGG